MSDCLFHEDPLGGGGWGSVTVSLPASTSWESRVRCASGTTYQLYGKREEDSITLNLATVGVNLRSETLIEFTAATTRSLTSRKLECGRAEQDLRVEPTEGRGVEGSEECPVTVTPNLHPSDLDVFPSGEVDLEDQGGGGSTSSSVHPGADP